MFSSRPILFVLVFVVLHSVHSEKICDFKDKECMIRGAQNALNTIIPGIKGLIEPSDPLHLPDSEGEIPALKYKIINSTLSGMTSCQLINVTMNTEESSFRSELLCRQLVIRHNFEAKGYIGAVEIDGQDNLLTLTLNNYLIKFKGEYAVLTSDIDQKSHFIIKSCHQEFEPHGEVKADIQNPLHSDKVKSDLARAYLMEHPNELEKRAHSPVLENYMKIFIKNIDTYTRAVPADVVFPAII